MSRGVLNRAPLWKLTCDTITLWHGCTDADRRGIEQNGIDLSLSRPDLDFGRGFYTTTLQRQAQHWAVRRYESRFVSRSNNRPVILQFTVSRINIAKLVSLSFINGRYENEDYWSLVQYCRQSKAAKNGRLAVIHDHHGPITEGKNHWYDMICGPVVADWKQRATLHDMDQFSFHTKAAVKILNDVIQSGDVEKYTWQMVTT